MPGRRILIVSPEPVGRLRTGVGIRLSEMARVLAFTHDVTLVAPAVEPEAGLPYRLARHSPPPLPELLAACDVVIVHGHVGNDVLAVPPRVPVVFDLYDPFVVENLAYAETMGPAVHRFDLATLERQIRHGDFFLCASETQRAFYLGMLTILGRVNAGTYGKGRDLRHLLAVVPFGVPDPGVAPPPIRTGAWRQRLGLGEAKAMFFGGIYDWYDPFTALEALGRVRQAVPGTRLVIVRNPRQETTPQALFARTLARAGELGLKEALVVSDWIPYEERGAALADMDLGLVSHRAGIETDLSYRTRVLDFLWAGLPVVATEGGSGSDLVERAGAGILAPVGDAAAVAREAVAILQDGDRAAALGRAGQAHVTAHMTWPRVLAPLLDWLREPAPDVHKPPVEHTAPPRGLLSRLLSG